MPPGIGYSFNPSGDTLRLNQPRTGGVSGMAPQEAVKFLSLRLPERPSPTAIAPQALLKAQGGQPAMGGGADLKTVIEGLIKIFNGGGQPGMSGGGAPPPPKITPPIGDPTGKSPGDLGPVDYTEILKGKTGGNTGIGNTGKAPGPLGPAPPTIPPQDFQTPQGPLGPAPGFTFGDQDQPTQPFMEMLGRRPLPEYAPSLF